MENKNNIQKNRRICDLALIENPTGEELIPVSVNDKDWAIRFKPFLDVAEDSRNLNETLRILLANGYMFKDVAVPDTAPEEGLENVLYLTVTPGTYTHFGGIAVEENELAILYPKGSSWVKKAVTVMTTIADGSITKDKIAPGAVRTSKLYDGSIITSKLADKSVTRDKIADDVLSTVYRYVGSVDSWEDLLNKTSDYNELPQYRGCTWNVNEEHDGYPAGTDWAWTGFKWNALGGDASVLLKKIRDINRTVFVTPLTDEDDNLPLFDGSSITFSYYPWFSKNGVTVFIPEDGVTIPILDPDSNFEQYLVIKDSSVYWTGNVTEDEIVIGYYFYGTQTFTAVFPWRDTEDNYILPYTTKKIPFRLINKNINVTYEKLVSLRDNNLLIPGQYYRITDFCSKVIDVDNELYSLDKPFDIIVLALSNNILSEDAKAIQHEGDTYFDDCNLAAWELKYCLDNDTNRFYWASERGNVITGNDGESYTWSKREDIIYIQGEEYEVYNCTHYNIYDNEYYWLACKKGEELTIHSTVYSVTEDYDTLEFVAVPESFTLGEVGWSESFVDTKGVIYYMKDEWGNEAFYDFKNINCPFIKEGIDLSLNGSVKGNKIIPQFNYNYLDIPLYLYIRGSYNIINISNQYAEFNIYGSRCIIGGRCDYINIDQYSNYVIIKDNATDVNITNSRYINIGYDCGYIEISESIHIDIGDYCSSCRIDRTNYVTLEDEVSFIDIFNTSNSLHKNYYVHSGYYGDENDNSITIYTTANDYKTEIRKSTDKTILV